MKATLAALWLALAAATPSQPGDGDGDGDGGDGGRSSSGYETVVRAHRVEDGLDAQRRIDTQSPGFATAIELEHEAGSRPSDALPEVLARSTAVTVRSLGGLGQYSSVSLRGSSAQQVAVFIDGVPLGTSVGGLVDLSDLPLDVLERVEIYRGYVPIAFGSAAIGGVVNLVGHRHRGPARVSAGLGGGSYGGREARVAARMGLRTDDTLALRVGYGAATGDFPFLDVNNTPAIPERHTTSLRKNNGFERLVGQLRYEARQDLWRIRVQEIGLKKTQGIPGTDQRQSSRSKLATLGLQTIANAQRKALFGPGGRLEIVFGFGFERRHFEDPLGEVGIAVDDEESDIIDTFLSPRVRVPLWDQAFFDGVLDLRHEWTGVDNRLRLTPQGGQATGDASRQRFSVGVGIELEQFLLARRLILAPALRIERVWNFFAVPEGQGEFSDEGRDYVSVGVAPRLGMRLRLIDGLELRASGGRYFRPPNLLELFGDRGFIVGNEGLVPERGTSADAGLVLDMGQEGPFGLYAQLAGFYSQSDHLIQWQQAGLVLRPSNIGGATTAGVEAGLSGRLWHDLLKAQANYTYLSTRNNSPSQHAHGQPLPGRPEHEMFARVSGGHPIRLFGQRVKPRGFYTVEFVAGTFLDPSGRRPVPARWLHGLGMEVEVSEWLRLALEARNLLDTRTTTWTHPSPNLGTQYVPLSDFAGYPLPGRSFWFSIAGRYDLGNG